LLLSNKARFSEASRFQSQKYDTSMFPKGDGSKKYHVIPAIRLCPEVQSTVRRKTWSLANENPTGALGEVPFSDVCCWNAFFETSWHYRCSIRIYSKFL